MSDADLIKEYNENYRYASQFWAPYIQDANVYTLAASGSTWSESERQALIREGREPIEFNIMRRPLQFFSGWMRDNLNSIVYGGQNLDDDKTADQFTKVSDVVWDKGSGYCTFLDAQDEAMKSGMALTGLRMDYTSDVSNGDICFYYRTYNSFYLDPNFTRIDLQDCGYAMTRDLIGFERARQLLDFMSEEELEGLCRNFRDDKYLSYRPTNAQAARNRTFAYDQYYRRTTRMRKYLVDHDSGVSRDITDLEDDEKERLMQGVKRMQDALAEDPSADYIPNVEVMEVERPYVELTVFVNGHPVFTGEDKTQITETYPFAPNLCFFEPSIWQPHQRVQGMGSSNWSLQRQFNKRHMKIIDMMDSTISTGYKYLIGAVEDPEDLLQSGASRLIGIDPENAPEGLNSVQELAGGGANPALIQYQDVLDKLSLTLGNVTEASLGMDEKRNTLVSGRLAQVQIAQNLMANRKVFDNVDTTQKVLASLVLRAIQKNYPERKVERLINEEPTEDFYNREISFYDIVIKEGVRTQSQRDAYYFELVNLKREGIVDVPESSIIKALSMTGASDLRDDIEAQEQAKAEQQAKINEQERMALELANSQKEENIALAQERRARVLSDVALATERQSEAAENRAQAALARAKTITEIASMQDERILRVLQFVEQLEQQEQAVQNAIVQSDLAKADMLNEETEGSAEHMEQQVNQQLSDAANSIQ